MSTEKENNTAKEITAEQISAMTVNEIEELFNKCPKCGSGSAVSYVNTQEIIHWVAAKRYIDGSIAVTAGALIDTEKEVFEYLSCCECGERWDRTEYFTADVLNSEHKPAIYTEAFSWIYDRFAVDNIAFHVDTPFTDYVDVETGGVTYLDVEAARMQLELDDLIARCDAAGIDIHSVSLDAYKKWEENNVRPV